MAEDVLAMGEPRLTDWGRSHKKEMVIAMGIWLDQQDGTDLSLESWIIDRPMVWQRWILESKAFEPSSKMKVRELRRPGWPYSGFGNLSGTAILPNVYKPILMTAYGLVEKLHSVVREVENMARDIAKTPRVGEGWISETDLHNLIASTFGSQTLVVQHGRPHWLRAQHLDTWIPEWNVAIEYQGVQHDRPVAFFGGEVGWLATQARDERKRTLCKSHKLTLIEVRPGYDPQEIIDRIREARSS
jgi:hypothetical protein